MRSRRIVPLHADELSRLPEPCPRCVLDQQSRLDSTSWAAATTAEWGQCGLVALNDQICIGYLILVPAEHLPRRGPYLTTSVSADAAVIVSLRVLDGFTGQGIGHQLIQGAAALAVRRRVRALETVGSYGQSSCSALPVRWLESVGFTVARDHPLTPRLRMDLSSTLRWATDLGAAWQRLSDLVSRPVPPEPARFSAQETVPAQTGALTQPSAGS